MSRITGIRYGAYCVPLSSCKRPAAEPILSGAVWEQETLEYITAKWNGGDIVHAGTYFAIFSRRFRRPQLLHTRSLRLNQIRKTSAVPRLPSCQISSITTNCALSEAGGEAWSSVRSKGGVFLGAASHICETPNGAAATDVVRVRCCALDDILPGARHVSLMHLDVEAHEAAVLAGAARLIKRDRPILILKTLPDESWLRANILDLGYVRESRVCGNYVLTLKCFDINDVSFRTLQ